MQAPAEIDDDGYKLPLKVVARLPLKVVGVELPLSLLEDELLCCSPVKNGDCTDEARGYSSGGRAVRRVALLFI